MQYKQNKRLVPFAKDLRREMTKEERHLWYDYLRSYPIKIVRQKVLGRYIADFYCAAAHLVIELDGSQHYEEDYEQRDQERTKFLEQYGLSVVRIPNSEVNRNFNGVCEYLGKLIEERVKQDER